MTQQRETHLPTGTGSAITLGVFTRRLRKNDFVRSHFNSKHTILKPKAKHAEKTDLVVGWGRKPQALTAAKYAKQFNIPFTTLEDGFIHSMSQGRLGANSWSLVTDERGIYYDATTSSDLEQYINTNKLTSEQEARASQNIKMITELGITKYNNAKLVIPDAIQALKNTILVIDQVQGDMSIEYALASNKSFGAMYTAALEENPDSDILIKVHPDVINGKRKGCIPLSEKLPERVHVVSENINPVQLLKHIEKVYVVSSQMGFEALLMNKHVTCFGVPFYAGWGLTDDRADPEHEVFKRRRNRPTVKDIFHAAYIYYSHYFHPDTEKSCALEEVLDYVQLQYKTWKEHSGKIFCIGFSPWKKRFIMSYLKTPDNQIILASSADDAKQKGFDASSTACLWSSRFQSEAEKLHAEFKTPIWRIEDGFIRSVSLGSNYAPPASLVIDKQGLYFNPHQPSDLETILLETDFTEDQLDSAQQLKEQLISQAVSKYNVGARGLSNLFTDSGTHRKLLVPGQVEDDASILMGCQSTDNNTKLLKTVRENHPDAYIIYKPHPDVFIGNREGHVDDHDLKAYCDQVVIDVSITDCLQQVDEVHTMTSLVGFEALIRDLKVYCYGTPFYSGWGLTNDSYYCSRRTRLLTINQLVAGTLLHYPLYINWSTQRFTTATHLTNTIYDRVLQLEASGKSQCEHLPRAWKSLSLLATMFKPTLK